MNRVSHRHESRPDHVFVWKTSKDEFISIDQMEARHLFFTVRMIWNHTMPEDAKLRPFRRYEFGPYYTSGYMAKAVRAMVPELGRRMIELKAWQIRDLYFMAAYIRANGLDQSHLESRRMVLDGPAS